MEIRVDKDGRKKEIEDNFITTGSYTNRHLCPLSSPVRNTTGGDIPFELTTVVSYYKPAVMSASTVSCLR